MTPRMRNSALVILMLGLLAAIIYWRVGRFGFIDYDDPAYVSQNSHVQAGFNGEGVRYALTTHDVGNWNPLVWFSFYADRALFGLKPGAMHLENVALHLLASIMLFLVF
jgi:protein O-mannosyl-transferase